MFFSKRRIVSILTACAFTCTTAAAIAPSTAHASLLGAIIGTGIQAVQQKKELDHYNDTEEGRQELFSEMKQKYGVTSDWSLNNRLDNIMANLTTAVAKVDPSIEKKPYNYFINTDDSFNAACSLGHNMMVNRGIFNILPTDDEIAVVIGHEMGHGQKNHVVKGFEKSVLPTLAANIVIGTSGNAAGIGASILANYTQKVHVSKPLEWDADNLAFDYISNSNYNLGACAAVWQRVIEEYPGKESSFAGDIFSPSDHPGHAERRDSYAKKLYEYSNKKVSVADGTVKINDKALVTPVAAAGMSGAERSYFVAGNLARVYHSKNVPDATVSGGTIYMGSQAIMTPAAGDVSASEIASKINEIK